MSTKTEVTTEFEKTDTTNPTTNTTSEKSTNVETTVAEEIEDTLIPRDIPWQRLATSADMVDFTPGNHQFPPLWHSSMTLYHYLVPDEDVPALLRDAHQVYYLKLSTSITGVRPGNTKADDLIASLELAIPRDSSLAAKLVPDLAQAMSRYWPCLGAIVQLAVFRGGSKSPSVKHHLMPYIADVEPKQREMVEVATEAGEVAQQSSTNLNVRKSVTATDTTEMIAESSSGITASFGVSGGWGSGAKAPAGGTKAPEAPPPGSNPPPVPPGPNVGGQSSVGFSWGSKQTDRSMAERQDMTVRTVDHSREKKETTSHQTTLEQLYHLIDCYHVGTNRVAHFISPRPHVQQDPDRFTLVQGPREIEGVQDFFYVVMFPRGKEAPKLCVDAVLETAHLDTSPPATEEPPPPPERYATEGFIEQVIHDATTKDSTGEITVVMPQGMVVDRRQGLGQFASWLPPRLGGDPSGNPLLQEPILSVPLANSTKTFGWDVLLDQSSRLAVKGRSLNVTVADDQVTFKWNLRALPGDQWTILYLVVRVYYRSEEPLPSPPPVRSRPMWVTARGLSECIPLDAPPPASQRRSSPWVSYQNHVPVDMKLASPTTPTLARLQASNSVGRAISAELRSSLASPLRFPPATVSVEQSDLLPTLALARIADIPDTDPFNDKVLALDGLDKELASRIAKRFGRAVRRKQLARLSLSEMAAALRVDLPAVLRLRRVLAGLSPRRKR